MTMTGNSANIASMLDLKVLRCGAHVVALVPKHQFYEVERVVGEAGARRKVKQMHENADKECYDLVERVRQIHAKLRKEQLKLKLEGVQKGNGRPLLVPTGDSSAKWSGIFAMLERHWSLRRDIEDLVLVAPHCLDEVGGCVSSAEWDLLRDSTCCWRCSKNGADLSWVLQMFS